MWWKRWVGYVGGSRELGLFLLASFAMGMAYSIFDAVFNNFLNERFALTGFQRSFLEFPRELPGVLVVFVTAGLSFLCSRRLGVVAMLLGLAGTLLVGFASPTYGIMLMPLFIYSLGQHHIALLWSGTLTLTLGSMVVFDRLNATWLQPRLQSAAAWGVVLALLAVGLALPCFPAVPALLQTHVIRIAGLIFAYNYKSLAAVVKRYTVPKTVPAVPIPTPS